jgi:hypothetical protein
MFEFGHLINYISFLQNVIRAAEREGKFDDLVRYLEMARKNIKERSLDSALVYALAQVWRLFTSLLENTCL